MTTTLPLEGTAALVTGGGSGIGLAAARALVRDGASVTLMGRNGEKLEAAARSLRDDLVEGATVLISPGDVTAEEDVVRAVETAASPTGRLDAAVAAAGDGTLGPVIAMPLEEWNRILGVALTGTFLTFKHAGALMGRQGGGSLVAVSSIASRVTHPYMAPYAVAKAGVDMLVKSVADELGRVGVRANAVNPGIIQTDLVAMITPEDSVGRSYLESMPISRFGTVEDVAPLIRFLCGPESSFITGETIGVDGGHHLRRGPDFHELASALYGSAADGLLPGSQPPGP